MLHQLISFIVTTRRETDRAQQTKIQSRLVEESVALVDCALDAAVGLYLNWDTFKNETDHSIDPIAVTRFIVDALPDDFKFRTLRVLSKSLLNSKQNPSNDC